MSDLALRLVVVGAVVVVAVVVGMITRRGVVVRRRSVSVPGGPDGLTLFASDTCDTCGRVAGLLDDALGEDGYRRVTHESDPDVFRRVGIGAVPAIVYLDADGRGWSAAGIPSRRRLERWLRNP